MNMHIKPRYVLVAAVVGAGLYLAGTPVVTVLALLGLAYMMSMHLGGHGGHGGHGGAPTDPPHEGGSLDRSDPRRGSSDKP